MPAKFPQPQLLFGYVLLALSIMGCTGLFLWNPVPLQSLRNATFDQFLRTKPRHYQDTPVRVIGIDDESLRRLGQWPWPRTRIARLLTKLQAAEPAAVAIDIIFAEKDNSSPPNLLDIWQIPEDKREWLSQLPDHDRVLADALRQTSTALGFALSRDPDRHDVASIKAKYVVRGESAPAALESFPSAIASLPILESAARGNGALNFKADVDGVIRKVPLLLRQQDALVPSLVAEALRLAQNRNNYLVKSRTDGQGVAEVDIGKFRLPTTATGEIWLNYSQHNSQRYVPAWQILERDGYGAQLNNKILLLGLSAQGLMDQRFSPLGGIIPGIEIHAQALEQIFANQLLTRPEWADGLELSTILLGGLLIGGLTLHLRAIRSFSVCLTGIAVLWAGAWHAFAGHRLLIDPLLPSILLLLIFLVSSLYRHIYSERWQRWVKQAFSRYISPNLVEHLINHPDELQLGSHRRTCSFVFTDLTDFTKLMENLDPGQAVDILNDYLENMVAIAFSHHGTLDRIVGDAVAIMFSAPIRQEDHQCRAVQCALAMQNYARNYAAELNSKGIAFGQTRIGVHSGEVIVGNFGGKTAFDYRALGDAVNTTARLEGANKYLGTQVCVSEATLSGCGGIPARPIGRVVVKGKARALTVYEPLELTAGDAESAAAYQAAYALLCAGQSQQALSAFRAITAAWPEDRLSAMHLQRLRSGCRNDLIELIHK